MCKRFLRVLGLWLFGAGPLFAQPAPATDAAAPGASATSGSPSAGAGGDGRSATAGTSAGASVPVCGLWARPDYLLWWVKKAPLPVPVVTTGDASVGFDPNSVNTVNNAGAVGQRGTRVLLGDQDLGWRAFSGMRLTLGGWIDHEETFGVEGSGFVLERLTNHFATSSDKTGNPPLYFPDFSATASAERAVPIADPLRGFSGAVVADSTVRLWGAECDGIVTLIHNPGFELTFLAGFRYADLLEHLRTTNTTTDLIFGNAMTLTDSFSTRNQFYGGQAGGRLTARYECYSLEVTGKVALGSTHQEVEILGTITQAETNPLIPPGLGTFPGGLYTQKTNIGRSRADEFTVLSSLELKLGYDIGPRTRAFAGYDFFWWSRVVRPGEQINHRVNLTQNAVLDPNGVGKLVGPAQPLPLFNRSDFWAQGLSFGLEFLF